MVNASSFEGRIPALVALALLESLRDVDMPSDPSALGESDLPLNLQRRLGLSSVVVDQIHRYEQRRGGDVPAVEVASLFELIGRRSDASRIFVEAGQRIARADLKNRRAASRLGLRLMPQPFRERGALRRARRIARRMSPGADIRLHHKPHTLIVKRGLPASAAKDGTGCAVLAGAIQYVFTEFRAGDFNVVHDHCEAHHSDRCEWQLSAFETAEAVGQPEPVPGG
jgi:predicted hydrocarbon binding protein